MSYHQGLLSQYPYVGQPMPRGGLLAPLMDPRIKSRSMLWPFGLTKPTAKSPRGQVDVAMPEMLLGLAKAPMLPLHVLLGGSWGEEDVTDMAMNVAGTGYLGGGLLTGGVPRGAVLGANVWHGGPNRWMPEPGFPQGRPRLDRVGTGEGAGGGGAAYGHGFYSAEAPGVAKTYQQAGVRTIPGAFTGGSKYQIEGVEFPKGRAGHMALDTGMDIEGYLYHRMTGTSPEMETYLRGQIDRRMARWRDQETGRGGVANEHMQELSDFWDIHARKADPSKIKEWGGGTLKKLDIPDEDIAKFLDWDAPLSEQPKAVKAALAKLDIEPRWQVVNDDGFPLTGKVHLNKHGAILDARKVGGTVAEVKDALQGSAIYKMVGGAGGDKRASEALRKAGIPGLKYYDQMSRGVNKGTVEFDGIDVTSTKAGEIASDFLLGKKRLARFGEHGGDPVKASKIFDEEMASPLSGGPKKDWVDAGNLLREWAANPKGVSIKDKGTRNYVTWDQDVLNRTRILESGGAMATVDSSVHGNTLIIHKIETPPNMRGTGKAEQALNDILRQADEQGLAVALTPTKAFGASKGRLEKWYRRHGFVPNKGRNKDFSTKESMIRPQSQDLKSGGETVGLLKKPRK